MTKQIRLTTSSYWAEIRSMELPNELVSLLTAIVNAQIHSVLGPTASPHLVRLMREHVPGGILLCDSACDLSYDVVVFVPDPERNDRRSFFKLIPRYDGGRFKYLDQI